MLRYTLRQLEYLIACIDTGSLVGAARKLNVSQPSISTAIAKLEAQLGVQLLIRHHAQGVVPTAHAESTISAARNLLLNANEFQQSIEEAGNEVRGEVNLGSFISLAPTYLPGLIAALGETYPNLQLNIGEGTQDQLVEGLRRGNYESALVYDYDLPLDLHKTELMRIKPQILLPHGHALAAKDQVSLAELASEPLVLLDIQPSREFFTGLFRSTGFEPKISYRSSSIELVRGLVGRGLGYSLLVTRPPGDITYDGQLLEIRPIEEDVEFGRINLCRLSSVRAGRTMLAFEEFALSYFSDKSTTN
ncbi:MAG: LysR family transcriptional regulator [Rhizobiaceae bacterium]